MNKLIKFCFINAMLTILFSASSYACSGKGCQKSILSQEYIKGKFVLGNSYKVNWKKYTPKVDHKYYEVGIASWYGGNFLGRKTANGSIFTGNEYTAAHRTLPLPCVAKITNMNNMKVIEVVINDRGPFNNRIIDLSQRAAEHLGFANAGTAKVKVEYLHDKTLALLAMYPKSETDKALKTFHTAMIKKEVEERILQ